MRDSYTKPFETKQIKYFGIFDLTKWIHDTNLWKTGLQNKSTIWIFKVWICKSGFASPPAWIHKDLFRAIVLRIRKDSWGFVGFMKTGQIFGKSVCKTNPWNKSFENIKDSWSTIRNESNLFEVRIHSHDTVQIHGFVSQIHVFTNLLYDSCILTSQSSIPMNDVPIVSVWTLSNHRNFSNPLKSWGIQAHSVSQNWTPHQQLIKTKPAWAGFKTVEAGIAK